MRSSRLSAAIGSKIRSATAGARPIDGSSSNNSCGEEAMPRPIASIWLLAARERPRQLAAAFGENREQGKDALDAARPLLAPVPRVGTHFEVFEHRQRGEDLPPFGYVRDADMGALPRRHAEKVVPIVAHPPAERRDGSRDRLELSGPAG